MYEKLTTESPGPSLAVVIGEGGIGKSRIVEDVTKRRVLEGCQILSARAAEFEDCIPLNPIIDSLDRLNAKDLEGLVEPWSTVLQDLLPGVSNAPSQVLAPTIQPGSVPRRLFEAFLRLFEHLSRKRPVLLFLDDVHWIDETSLSVIQFIRRRAVGDIEIVLVFTTEMIQKRACIENFLDSVPDEDEKLCVRELDPEDAETLVLELAGNSVVPEALVNICALGAGNPFYLTELTAEYLAGRLIHAPETLDPPLPPSVRHLLEPRLSGLSIAAGRMLAALAVSGHPQSIPDVVRLLELDADVLIDASEELLMARLVTERDARYVITHPMLRRAVYDRIGPARRCELHERVAQSFARSEGDGMDGAVALHFDRSGNSAEAVRFALRAADRAEQSGAVPETIKNLSIARRHEQRPDAAREILCRLGHLHYLHQDLEQAAAILGLASDQLKEAGQNDRAWEAQLEQTDCLLRLNPSLVPDLLDRLVAMRASFQTASATEAYAKALDIEVHALDRVGDTAGIRTRLEEAEAVLRIGTPLARCRAHCTMALHQLHGNAALALNSARQAVELAEASELVTEWPIAINRLIVVLIYRGSMESERGLELLERAENAAARAGDLLLRFTLGLNRGVWYLETANYAAAEVAFEKAQSIVGEPDDPAALYSDPVVEVVANIHVNITGAVSRAGQYFVPPSATLVDALALAGGAGSEVDVGLQGGASDPARVRLVRDGVATVIDMRPLDVRPEVLSLRVQSGDWLHVPRAIRSQRRDDVTFYGTVLTTLLTLVSLIVLIGR